MKRFTLIVSCLALWSVPVLGQDVVVTQISDELVLGARAGEAWVVADPEDPDNVVAIWLATRNTSGSGVPTPPTEGEGEEGCGIGRSTDGGQTWSVVRAPYDSTSMPNALSICGDPTAVVLPDGSIVLTAVQLGADQWLQSISSFDKGVTWTTPSTPFGANAALASALATQSIPDMGAGRQWTTADPITKEIFIQSQVDAPTTGRHMVVSTDRGLTWRVPRNTGSTSLGPIGAAYGIVAGVYRSGSDRIFQTSTNHGRTWTRNILPVPVEGTVSVFGGANTVADPTTMGRFAVLISSGDTLEVWITTDAGRSPGNWTQAVVFSAEAGDSIAHSWIGFGRNGALGLRWRSVNADGSYDLDAVVSADGGTNWGDVVRLTAARGPSPAAGPGGPGDDCACNVYLTDNRLLTTWGDNTSGNREMWFGSYDYTAP